MLVASVSLLLDLDHAFTLNNTFKMSHGDNAFKCY